MEKDGKQEEFKTYPTDTAYTFVSMIRLNPETDPKITDYAVYDVDNQNVTQQTFEGTRLIILIEKSESTSNKGIRDVLGLTSQIQGVEMMIFTSSSPNVFEEFRHEMQIPIPYYFVDSTVLKAMVRSNPGVILMKNGTVLGKWHYNDVPSAETIYKFGRLVLIHD